MKNYRDAGLRPHRAHEFPQPSDPDEIRGADGSSQLSALVGLYLLAMLGGILLLGALTAPTTPPTQTTMIAATP